MKGQTRKRRMLTKAKFLQTDELAHLESTLHRFIDRDERNCLAIWTLLKTGARATELLNIEKDDLDHHDNMVHLVGLKGSLDRDVPIPPGLFARLLKYSKTVEGTRLFPISYKRLQEI